MMNASRRALLKGGLAAFAGITILPRSVFGANEKLNIAFIGVGGKGEHAIKNLEQNPLVNIVAFADVDEKRSAAMVKAHPSVPMYRDFRVMLDKEGARIDGVVISTPDHSHHFIGKTCMLHGKHIYLEKPLAHTIAEVRDLMALEKRTGLVCQMGNQGHSGAGIQLLNAWVKAGVFGTIQEVHAWSPIVWSRKETERLQGEPAPASLDWDLWLGVAGQRPYSPEYLPAKWRGWFDFGEGTLGDWACHNMDAPYDALGLDCPSKIEIESTGPKPLSFPDSAKIRFTFPATADRGETVLTWYQGKKFTPPRPADFEPGRQLGNNGGGTLIVGSEATGMMTSHAGTLRIVPEARMKEMSSGLPRVDGKRSEHFTNWLLACKGEELARSHFGYAGRLTETMLFGNIALHLNTNLTIDPVRREIIGNDQAQRMMAGPPPRAGWEI